jgi:hypothetical protein
MIGAAQIAVAEAGSIGSGFYSEDLLCGHVIVRRDETREFKSLKDAVNGGDLGGAARCSQNLRLVPSLGGPPERFKGPGEPEL